MIKIQEKDKIFCQKHQQAFDAAKKSLALLLECSEAAAAAQDEIFPDEPRYVQNVYLGNDIADGEIVRKAIRSLPRTFIEKISSYFTTEYRVPINYGAIQMDLLPRCFLCWCVYMLCYHYQINYQSYKCLKYPKVYILKILQLDLHP